MDVAEARDLAHTLLHLRRATGGCTYRPWPRGRKSCAARSARPRGSCWSAAAWLHDIGYSPELSHEGFHPLDGAAISRRGHPREAALVAHHSGARFVAELRGLAPELSAFRFVEDAVTDALTCADQTHRTARGAGGRRGAAGRDRPRLGPMRRPASPPRGVIPTSAPPSTGRSDGSAGRRRSLRTVDTPTVGSQAPPAGPGR